MMYQFLVHTLLEDARIAGAESLKILLNWLIVWQSGRVWWFELGLF